MIVKIIFFILLLNIYFILPIISQSPKPTSYTNDQTSIVIQYNAADIYYSKWALRRTPKINMTFVCSLVPPIRTCTYTATTPTDQRKVLYGNGGITPCITTSLGIETCSGNLDLNHYPTPQITNVFAPPTKGGDVLLQGTFLIMTGNSFTTQNEEYPLIREIDSTSFDPTNLTLGYPPGCGAQTFIYPNGKTFSFKYQAPKIVALKRVKSTIVMNGTNFCDMVEKIDIKVDGTSIDNSKIKIQNNQIIDEIHFDHEQEYSSNIKVKIISGGSESNELPINFPPMVTSISSAPLKGGIVTIIGERLISSNGILSVTLGGVPCVPLSYTTAFITCNITAGSGDKKVVSVIANGIPNDFTNETAVYFSYGIPTISSYSVNGNTVTLVGVNFGNSTNSSVVLTNPVSSFKGIVSTDETNMVFTLPSNYVKQSIRILANSIASNSIEVDVNFNLVQKTYPLTDGQLINYQFNNVFAKNYDLIPDIVIIGGINGNSTIKSTNNTREGSTSNFIFSFTIPSGCGKKDIEAIIGDQHHISTLRYDNPIIKNCSTSLDSLSIICYGLNFGIDTESVIVRFSGLEVKPIQINHTTFSISNNGLFKTGEMSITVCKIDSIENVQVEIESFFLSPPKLSTTGGIIEIIRHAVSSNIDTSIDCGLDGIFKCNLVNETLYNCPVNLTGPNERICKLNFQGESNKSVIVIGYLLPIVIKVDTTTLSGGKLTIYGNEFYNSTKSITIGSLNCGDIQYIDSSTLSCTLENNLNLSQSYDEYLYVNITNSNDKSNGSFVFQYFNPNIHPTDNPSDENSGEDGGETEEEKKKKKLTWLIPSIIVPIVFVIAVIFIGPELYRRYYTFPPPKPIAQPPGFERRPYNPPNLNNRLYEDTPALYRYDSENPPQLSFVPIQP